MFSHSRSTYTYVPHVPTHVSLMCLQVYVTSPLFHDPRFALCNLGPHAAFSSVQWAFFTLLSGQGIAMSNIIDDVWRQQSAVAYSLLHHLITLVLVVPMFYIILADAYAVRGHQYNAARAVLQERINSKMKNRSQNVRGSTRS